MAEGRRGKANSASPSKVIAMSVTEKSPEPIPAQVTFLLFIWVNRFRFRKDTGCDVFRSERLTDSILSAVLLDVNLPASFATMCLSPDITAGKTFNRHADSFLLPTPLLILRPLIVYNYFALMAVTGASQLCIYKAHRILMQRLDATCRDAHQLAYLHAHTFIFRNHVGLNHYGHIFAKGE